MGQRMDARNDVGFEPVRCLGLSLQRLSIVNTKGAFRGSCPHSDRSSFSVGRHTGVQRLPSKRIPVPRRQRAAD
jgi:hypothetical protein